MHSHHNQPYPLSNKVDASRSRYVTYHRTFPFIYLYGSKLKSIISHFYCCSLVFYSILNFTIWGNQSSRTKDCKYFLLVCRKCKLGFVKDEIKRNQMKPHQSSIKKNKFQLTLVFSSPGNSSYKDIMFFV